MQAFSVYGAKRKAQEEPSLCLDLQDHSVT